MKPFFSIRIDYNPADNLDDQSIRDTNTFRITVARETGPEDPCGDDTQEDAERDARADTRTCVIEAVLRTLQSLHLVASKNTSWSFMGDLIQELIDQDGESEKRLLSLVRRELSCFPDDSFVEPLEKMIASYKAGTIQDEDD